jgi:hypothetical protein
VLYILIVMAGVYSSVTAMRVLSKSGISKTIRGLVLKRHVSLIALYCVSNMYIAIESYLGLTGKLSLKIRPDSNWFYIALKTVFYLQFLIGPLLRFSEQAFKTALMDTLMRDLSFLFCSNVWQNDKLEEQLNDFEIINRDSKHLSRSNSSIETLALVKQRQSVRK